jgi:prevent-host-death family protein
MAAIPKLVGISDLRLHQSEVLDTLQEGPVILTQRSRAVAVLVSPEQWNQLVADLEDLQDVLAAREARQELEPSMDLEEYARARASHVSRQAQ